MAIKEQIIIRMIGILNILFGIWFLVLLAPNFLLGVILGLVSDYGFHDAYDEFMSVIIGRLTASIGYIYMGMLVFSGISMIRMKNYSRKLALFSCITIIAVHLFGALLTIIDAMLYSDVNINPDPFYALPLLIFLIYTIFLLVYLNKPKIKAIFNDKDVKLSFKIPIVIIIIAFFSPRIINSTISKWIFNLIFFLIK